MWGTILILVALPVLMLLSATPLYAHEQGTAPVQQGAVDQRDADLREAHALTAGLRGVAARSGQLPAQADLMRQAERRRDLLNSLANTAPRSVLDLALKPAERSGLPPAVQSLVEQWLSNEGYLQVLHVDPDQGPTFYDISLVDQGRKMPLRFGNGLTDAQPGDRVQIRGVALAGSGTLVSDQIAVVRPAPTRSAIPATRTQNNPSGNSATAGSNSSAGFPRSVIGTGSGPVAASPGTAPPPTGLQRTAIILVSAPSAGSHPYANKTNTASIFFSFTNPLSAANFYYDQSYNATDIRGSTLSEGTAADIYGPYTLTTDTCDTSIIRSEGLAAADPAIDFNSYDRIVFSINKPSCGNGGVGNVKAQWQGTFDGVTQYFSVAWVYNSAMGDTAFNGRVGGVALHEYGHNMGVWHANALECGAAAIGSGGCYSNEYGDPADTMGNAPGYG